MNNKEKAYYIISKLDFNNLEVNTKPSAIIDNNKSVNLNWTVSEVSGGEIKESSGIKVLNFRTNNYKIFTTIPINTNIKNDSIQFEANILIPNIKANNIFFNIGASSGTGFRFNIKNTFIGGFEIFYNNKKITFNYKFENNVNYHILVTKEYNVYSFYINGLIIGNCVSDDFNNSITLSGTSLNLTIGAKSSAYSTTSDEFNGEISNVNISVSPYKDYLKYNKSFTKYGVNLVSRLNFGNLASTSNTTVFTANLEAVTDSKMNWSYGNLTIKDEYATVDGTPFESNISNINTIYFTLNNNNKIYNEIELLSLNNNYKIIYTSDFEGEPEPDVVVNANTTSALNFENGLNDKIETTIWNKEGTGNVQSVNKFFGENSFLTTSSTDSLYTSNNVISGGNIPFTIEFHALLKNMNNYNTLFSKNKNASSGEQFMYIDGADSLITYQKNNNGTWQREKSKNKVKLNEINKYTITYDSSALRVFLNDELTSIIGLNVGLDTINYTLPFRLLSSYIPSYANNRYPFNGIIDNINIHDGIATKVRDPDPYEEFLVVDLAFDGENNSTKIVDNGSLKSNWLVKFNNPSLKTSDSFDNKSALYLNGNQNIKSDIDISFNSIEDFTFSFEFMRIPTSQQYIVLISTNTDNYQTSTDVFSINAFTNNYTNVTASYLRNKLSFIDEKNFENDATNSLISITNILDNVKYKIDIVRKSKITYLYINNILDTQSNIFSDRAINFGKLCIGHCAWSEKSGYAVGLNGYIKNFKIYKGVAVIPEDPTGKIQLDFDNNLVDKYGNSTWSNTGGSNTTFDANNSVRGYSIYCNGSTSLSASHVTSNIITQNLRNNIYEYDFYVDNFDNFNIVVSTHYLFLYTTKANGNIYFEFYNNDAWISGYTSGVKILTKKWYNIKFVSFNDKVYISINDILTDVIHTPYTSISNQQIQSQYFVGGGWGGGYRFKGNIDNLRLENDTLNDVINYVNTPVVHLPLESNTSNIGTTNLTINSFGSPTYHTVEGKKCIKLESGKYLIITSNKIFELGTQNDFYIECEIYIPQLHINSTDSTKVTNGHRIFSSNVTWNDVKRCELEVSNTGFLRLMHRTSTTEQTTIQVSEQIVENKWYKIKLSRKGNLIKVGLNDNYIEYNTTQLNINFSSNDFVIGYVTQDLGTNSLDGYISNFKMFVGSDTPPENFDHRTVLDLDFAPTGKSYLFKDNNNKCIIHPVNITQRDYQNSQYCCSFNGTNQYLQLGKNELFNFGNDDFVIEVNFKVLMYDNWSFILSNNISSGADYFYFAVSPNDANGGKLFFSYNYSSTNYFQIRSTNKIPLNEIINAKIVRNGQDIKMYINDTDVTDISFSTVQLSNLNLNAGDNTKIGSGSSTFKGLTGYIYSIKVLRNTTDLSLLEEEKVIYSSDEKFVLTNGEESEEISFTEIKERDIKVINDNDKITFKIDDNEVELAKTTEVDNIKLFDGYTSQVKDVRVYDIAMYDDDEFLGSELIDTQYPELEFYDDSDIQELQVIDVGEYVIKGFIEGGVDRKYIIRNKVENFDLLKGSGDYYYDGIDERYIDDYEIYEIESKQRYPLYKHEMKKGYISGTVNLANCGLKKGQKLKVYCYRNDTQRLIGEYELDDYNRYEIPNLDVNSKYDIIFKDDSRKIENISSSYRTPKEY